MVHSQFLRNRSEGYTSGGDFEVGNVCKTSQRLLAIVLWLSQASSDSVWKCQFTKHWYSTFLPFWVTWVVFGCCWSFTQVNNLLEGSAMESTNIHSNIFNQQSSNLKTQEEKKIAAQCSVCKNWPYQHVLRGRTATSSHLDRTRPSGAWKNDFLQFAIKYARFDLFYHIKYPIKINGGYHSGRSSRSFLPKQQASLKRFTRKYKHLFLLSSWHSRRCFGLQSHLVVATRAP